MSWHLQQSNRLQGGRQLPPENQYGHTKKLRYLLSEIGRHQALIGRPVVLLDFGCGNGSSVSQYLMGEDIRYYGVDIHQPSLIYARQHFGGPDAVFSDHIPDGVQFDVIAYADVLEHIDDPASIIRQHRAKLAPDGIMIGAVPNGYGPFEIEQRFDRWLGLSQVLSSISRFKRRLLRQPEAASEGGLPYNHNSGHVFFFTQDSLHRVVVNGGLEVERFAHGAFIGASISGILLQRFSRLLTWNTWLADRLPSWAVSTWYFTLRRPSKSK